MNNPKSTAPSNDHTNLDCKNHDISDGFFVADSFASNVKGKTGLARILNKSYGVFYRWF